MFKNSIDHLVETLKEKGGVMTVADLYYALMAKNALVFGVEIEDLLELPEVSKRGVIYDKTTGEVKLNPQS